MPGFLTHYIAGQALLKVVDPKIQKIIIPCERLYNLGSQGPDIFFYYLPGHLRKRTRGVGIEMHQQDLGLFLADMAQQAKNAKSKKERDIIFSYTAGFIMHYVLDANAHPYVYAKSFSQGALKLKNSADHRKLETAIDVAMLKLTSGEKPSDYSQWELINAEKNQMSVASKAMSYVLLNTYKRSIPYKSVLRAMQYTVHLTRLLQSKHGKRKKMMQLAENLTIREPLFSSLIHDQEVSVDDCLNTLKNEWQAPWEAPHETHNDSFVERYHVAIEEGKKMIEFLHAYSYMDIEITQLAENLGNRSLKTGLTCQAS